MLGPCWELLSLMPSAPVTHAFSLRHSCLQPPSHMAAYAQARIHLAMPHVTNLAAKALNPALVAMVAKAGVPLLGSRRLFTSVGFIVSALCILPVARLKGYNPWVRTALLTLSPAWPTPSSPNLKPVPTPSPKPEAGQP